jgi:HPt (histidine-containing phosphotransfer) domain-containing protein
VRGSQAPTDAMPVLDEAALGDLIATLGEQAVANMLPTFVSNMVEYRDRLARAIAEADMVAAKRAAHAMKGLAAQFGAPRVSMLARLIEDEAHSVADVSKTLGKLVNAVAEAAQAIKAREKAQEVGVAASK